MPNPNTTVLMNASAPDPIYKSLESTAKFQNRSISEIVEDYLDIAIKHNTANTVPIPAKSSANTQPFQLIIPDSLHQKLLNVAGARKITLGDLVHAILHDATINKQRSSGFTPQP